MAAPATCCMVTWNRLAVERNVETRGLAENSPLHSLSKAWTQGRLSVRTHVLCGDWIIYGLKCLVAADIARASISHGSQASWWALSFALKNPASAKFSLRVMYSVAAMPGLLTAPSVTIQSWSKGCGRVMVRLSVKPLCKMEGVTQIVCLGDVLL